MPEPLPTIDVHAHLVPESLLDRVRAGAVPGLSALDTDAGVIITDGTERLGPFPKPMTDQSGRLAWMAERGITVQWVSPWLDLFTWRSKAPDARAWAELVNDELASAARSSDSHLRAVPYVDLSAGARIAADDALARAERIAAPAVMINSQAAEVTSLADESLDPLWAALADSGMPALLHPPVNGPSCALTAPVLQNVSGRLIDTSVAVLDLLIGGTFERHPNLTVLVVHGGGYLPYQAHRLDGLVRAGLLEKTKSRQRPSDAIKRMYFDTVALDEISIDLLVRRVGAEHVLLGSDAPFPIGEPDPVGMLGRAELSDEQRRLILSENASRLDAHAAVHSTQG